MKKLIITSFLGAGILLGTGCSKYLDVNDNPNQVQDVPENLILPGVEAVVGYNISGGMPARVSAYWTQQISYNAEGPDIDSYKLLSLDVNNTWTFDLYPSVLMNLKKIEAKAADDGNKYYGAIAKILLAYNLAVATDVWNAIPYKEAFGGVESSSPKYETQQEIYADVNALLDEGIALAADAEGGKLQPSSDDVIYQGDMEKWTRLAYTLKARYALRLINAPGQDKTALSNTALQALQKGFTQGEFARVPFTGETGGESPWNQFVTKWSGANSSFTFVEMLKAKNDPRIAAVAVKNKDGEYIGHKIGTTALPVTNDTMSAVGDLFVGTSAPVYLATYDEALFIKAEATYWTSGFAAAQPILTDAVKATMTRFGIDANSAEAAAYLTAHCQLTAANAYEVIMTEKYVSNFLSVEAFNDWRRSGYPVLQVVANPFVPTIPRRWPYATQEVNSNPQPEQDNVKITDRVWWDTK